MKIAYKASRARTPLREGCEADQRQATKQEAQPPNGEQSVISCIFRVFLNNLRNSLPGCKVAHSIRRSYLYKKVDEDDNVQSEISEKYPLTYYYIRKENTVSFYYYKNNLIAYYTHSAQDKVMYIIPLYDHTKNDYEIVLSDYEYNPKFHYEVFMFKTPNRQIYLLHQESISFKIVNISTGKILYDLQNYFSNPVACLFRSMPIANSFIVAIIAVANELIIHVIDLIKEKVYEQRCSVEKIKESILSLPKNDKYYEKLKSIEHLNKLYVDIDVKSKIDTSTTNSVIYNKYVVNITLDLDVGKATNALKDVISLIATYRNNELDVRFQVNKKVKLVTSSYTHEIDLGVTTILTSDKYEIDSKYNILQSRLYSVIISYDDYTIIYESNEHTIGFALYRKNESYIMLPYGQFNVNNLGDIMLIRIPNKILACGRKNSSIKTNRVNRYYVECVKDDSSDDSNICHDINVIETKVVRDLLLARIFESNGKNWVSIDITDKVKRIHLKNELEKAVQFYTRSVEEFSFFDYACYIDYGTEEFYSLVFLRYKSTGTKKYRVYLFKCKIDRLLSNRNPFILVWNFETSVLKSKVSNILHNLNRMISSSNKILRLLSKKFGKGIRFIGLKIFEAYDKSSAYHDYGYNRRSIRTSPKDSSIATTLHLVRRMLPTF